MSTGGWLGCAAGMWGTVGARGVLGGCQVPRVAPPHGALQPAVPRQPTCPPALWPSALCSVRFLCAAEAMPFELFENIRTNLVGGW